MQHSTRFTLVVLAGALACTPRMECASPAADVALNDEVRIVQDLEQRASHADPRDQAQMYADLTDRSVALASRQIADGELDAAEQTLSRIEGHVNELERHLQRDSKGLKHAEMLLHSTHRHLYDLMRAAPSEIKAHLDATIKRLNSAQTALLATIFAK